MNVEVSEIFKSIQGESTFTGLPCTFIRLAGCNLQCLYCDTKYACLPGKTMPFEYIFHVVDSLKSSLVEITGGEPLIQETSYTLISQLCDEKYTVLLETNGTISLEDVDQRTHIIMDLKTPSSGMSDYVKWDNLSYLKETDQIKFVIAKKDDYKWAKEILQCYDLLKKNQILFSPVQETLSPKKLSEWILSDNLPVRLNLQLHKYIWSEGEPEGIREI